MIVKPTAVVLAGGQSKRFGRNKLAVPYKGTTLLEHVTSVVAKVAEPVYLSTSRAENVYESGKPHLVDRFAGIGPLSGLESGLRASTTEWTLFVAGDMPGVTPEVLKEIIRSAAPDIQAVVPRTLDGFIHPLCALYHRSCLPDVTRAIDDRRYSIRGLVTVFETLFLPVDTEFMRNVNTLADLHRAENFKIV